MSRRAPTPSPGPEVAPRAGGGPDRASEGVTPASAVTVTVYRVSPEHPRGARETRRLVTERPLSIQIVGGERYTVMRTPGDELDLAMGFLLAEGLIEATAEVLKARQVGPDTLRVTLCEPPQTSAPRAEVHRNLVISSSCGLCGRDDVDPLIDRLEPVGPGPTVPIEALLAVPAAVRARQAIHDATGTCHAAALFDARGEVLAVREDIGRHSAVDKVIGHALRVALPLPPLGLLLSGRTSLELVIKAARAGVSLVVAVSGPSQEAIRVARKLGMTVCGFARPGELTLYTHPERVTIPALPVTRPPRDPTST